EALYPYHSIFEHQGYHHNYDYMLTVMLMNNIKYYSNGFLLLSESKLLSSPLATLHFEYYDSVAQVTSMLAAHKDEIQCVVGASGIPGEIPFGRSQQPRLDDYADGVDTVAWMTT